jgi:hypothetical protein
LRPAPYVFVGGHSVSFIGVVSLTGLGCSVALRG